MICPAMRFAAIVEKGEGESENGKQKREWGTGSSISFIYFPKIVKQNKNIRQVKKETWRGGLRETIGSL